MYLEMYSILEPYFTQYCSLLARVQVVHFQRREATVAYFWVLNAYESQYSMNWSELAFLSVKYTKHTNTVGTKIEDVLHIH
jgi:hypothetical protein